MLRSRAGVQDFRRFAFAAALTVSALVTGAAHAGQDARPAVPLEAIGGVLDAFKTSPVVALGEGPHGNERGHEFRLSLIRDSRFASAVNDIVVEAGNAAYQALMDAFIAGDDVPFDTLRDVWQNTTIAGTIWDRPMYFEFYSAVREVNRSRPASTRLRVLLGDPPIDWAQVTSVEQLNRFYPQRSRHAASIIQREVLGRQRRALVIYGDGHLQGRGVVSSHSLVRVLEREAGVRVFTISNAYPELARFQSDAPSWPRPSLVLLADTIIGRQPYARFYPIPPEPGWSDLRMEQQFDALLHLGGPSALSFQPLPMALCDDAGYLKMRLARLALTATPGNSDPAIGLKKQCAAHR